MNPRRERPHAPSSLTPARRVPEIQILSAPRNTSLGFRWNSWQPNALHADAGSGGGRSSAIRRRISANSVLGTAPPLPPGRRHGAMTDDFRADLDRPVLQTGQRPVVDRLGFRKRARKVAEIADERETEAARRWWRTPGMTAVSN